MTASIIYREFNQDQMDRAWEEVIAAKDTLDFNQELKNALARIDKVPAMAVLFNLDKQFLEKFSRASFIASLKLDQEYLIERLFEKALGIKLEDQDFYPGEAVAGIPMEMWVDLFKRLQPPVVEYIKKEAQRKNFPYDMLKDYIMGVKNVVKFCLDNNSRMVSYYSTSPGAFLRGRQEAVLARLQESQPEAV